jgi:hypothetical protein
VTENPMRTEFSMLLVFVLLMPSAELCPVGKRQKYSIVGVSTKPNPGTNASHLQRIQGVYILKNHSSIFCCLLHFL